MYEFLIIFYFSVFVFPILFSLVLLGVGVHRYLPFMIMGFYAS